MQFIHNNSAHVTTCNNLIFRHLTFWIPDFYFIDLDDLAVKKANTIDNSHDDIMAWKHFPYYWPFVRGIQWSQGIPLKPVVLSVIWNTMTLNVMSLYRLASLSLYSITVQVMNSCQPPCTYYSPISALFCPSVMGMHSLLISSVIRIRFEWNLLCTYNTSKNCSIAWQWRYLWNMNVIQRIEQVCMQNQTSTAEKLVNWSLVTPHTRTGLYFHKQWQHETPYTDGLGHSWSNWIADVLELPHSCTEPSICNQSDIKSQQTPPQ